MELSDYLKPRGMTNELAAKLGVSGSLVTQWCGGKVVSRERCAEIERLTDGAVTCEELRPDVAWHRVKDKSWPWHKAGRPLVDVTAGQGA